MFLYYIKTIKNFFISAKIFFKKKFTRVTIKKRLSNLF